MISYQNSNSGLAGVASLIVFIALVLVAAIAASVILDVSGALEQQASQTGEDAVDQLSSTLLILDVNGDVNENADGLDSVSYVVTTAAGSAPLNLDDITVSMTTSSGSAVYVSENIAAAEDAENFGDVVDDDANVGQFKINQIRGAPEGEGFEEDENVIRRGQDRFEITIPASEVEIDSSNGDTLETPENMEFDEADRVSVRFAAGPGGQSFNRFNIPSTITSDQNVIPL